MCSCRVGVLLSARNVPTETEKKEGRNRKKKTGEETNSPNKTDKETDSQCSFVRACLEYKALSVCPVTHIPKGFRARDNRKMYASRQAHFFVTHRKIEAIINISHCLYPTQQQLVCLLYSSFSSTFVVVSLELRLSTW